MLVPVVSGCEDMETVILADILRRAGGRVVLAGLRRGPVTCSHGLRLLPDALWKQVRLDDFDLLAIPGGRAGVDRLRRAPQVLEAIRHFDRRGKWLAAICAGPLVLQEAGILAGRRVTCHPNEAGALTATRRSAAAVVRDHRLITSQGAGATIPWALEIVAALAGRACARQIARGIVWRRGGNKKNCKNIKNSLVFPFNRSTMLSCS